MKQDKQRLPHRVARFYTLEKPPFETEQAQAEAFRELFSTTLGRQCLDAMILDMDFCRADLPSGKNPMENIIFNRGKAYFINHILSALGAKYVSDSISSDTIDDYEYF